MQNQLPQSQAYEKAFTGFLEAVAGEQSATALAARKQAFEHFRTLGFPSQKDERWRYTPLRSLATGSFTPPALAGVTKVQGLEEALFLQDAYRLLILDGRLVAEGSSALHAPGLTITQEPGNLKEPAGALAALNAAFAEESLTITLAAGQKLDKPLVIAALSSKSTRSLLVCPRLLLSLGEGAQMEILEQWSCDPEAESFLNSVFDISLAPESMLVHTRLQNHAANVFHLAQGQITLAEKSQYHALSLALGAKLDRQELVCDLIGKGASCHLHGLYLGTAQQHHDMTSQINHLAPDTVSRQTFKGALRDKAIGVFLGKIVVHPGAFASDGQMYNKTLLLSPSSVMNSKPELEIYTDEVTCAHGSAIGTLDAEALFYLVSRAIPESQARALLVEGFLQEVLDLHEKSSLQGQLTHLLQNALTS